MFGSALRRKQQQVSSRRACTDRPGQPPLQTPRWSDTSSRSSRAGASARLSRRTPKCAGRLCAPRRDIPQLRNFADAEKARLATGWRLIPPRDAPITTWAARYCARRAAWRMRCEKWSGRSSSSSAWPLVAPWQRQPGWMSAALRVEPQCRKRRDGLADTSENASPQALGRRGRGGRRAGLADTRASAPRLLLDSPGHGCWSPRLRPGRPDGGAGPEGRAAA